MHKTIGIINRILIYIITCLIIDYFLIMNLFRLSLESDLEGFHILTTIFFIIGCNYIAESILLKNNAEK